MKPFPLVEGDGRLKIEPTVLIPGTAPMTLTRSQGRRMIERFLASEGTNHSGMGATFWIIIAYCQHTQTPYRLTAIPGRGYRVEYAKELEF